MTILNTQSDGLYPELIVLFRAVLFEKNILSVDLIKACSSPTESDEKIRGALAKWESLGLFHRNQDQLTINPGLLTKVNKPSIDELTASLPKIACQLIMNDENCLPLWANGQEDSEKGTGKTADFVRGLSWCLAQDIYTYPTDFNEINSIENIQTKGNKKILSNDTRYNALRHWMRFLGFATGDGVEFKIDPTIAIRDCLPNIFSARDEIPADEFVQLLQERLPVIDYGAYRNQVEKNLNPQVWRKPNEKHLSISLSFALKRLDASNTIKLIGRADGGSGLNLTGQGYRTWGGFESVALIRRMS